MDPHSVSYLVAVGYLALFVPFWRYLAGKPEPRTLGAPAVVPRVTEGWFAVPDGVAFHPGHAWARADGDGLVTIGADDFAYKLVAPQRLELPPVGDVLRQGEPAWLMGADGHDVAVLSPVEGTVAEVNLEAVRSPETAAGDPYRAGWLLKVRAPRFLTDRKQLLEGSVARRWMQGVWDTLRACVRPDLGLALEDGGAPVSGIARALDAGHWSDVARRFLLS